jgi:hypothetical protein
MSLPEASGQERQPVVLRDESSHPGECQRGHRALRLLDRRIGLRCAHAAGFSAQRGEQGLRDSGYQGQTGATHEAAPEAQDMTLRRLKTEAGVDEPEKSRNRTKPE